MGLRIIKVTELPKGMASLAAVAHAEGYGMLDRLMVDFNTGANRFDLPGEALFAAERSGELVGIGGLNVDPYFDDPSIGRVRHLYVHPGQRRAGVGRAIVQAVEACAADNFDVLQLFTTSQAASRFYESLGFGVVKGTDRVSHRKRVPR